MDIKNIITTTFEKNVEILINFLPVLLIATIYLVAMIYLGKGLKKVILKIIKKSQFYKIHGNIFLRTTKIIYTFFGTIIFLNILGFKDLSTGLFASGGVVTIILGFALREIGENFCAGLLLSINKPFKIGDTIKSQDVEGSVKSIEIRYTHIRSADGKDVYVPSSQIYKNTLVNYTKDGLRRFDFTIGIDYCSNLKIACQAIDEELTKVSGILEDPKPGCVVKNLLPEYIEIIVYFWINTDDSISVKQVKEDSISQIKDRLITDGFILSNNTSRNHEVNIHYKDKITHNVN